MTQPNFLPGVPTQHIVKRLSNARGNELESGKFFSPRSSSALAVNCFGWFIERPALLPPFSGVAAGFPATSVEVEYEARFPLGR